MPTISVFYGILIQMFWGDHAPPHFHEDWTLCEQNQSPKKIAPLE